MNEQFARVIGPGISRAELETLCEGHKARRVGPTSTKRVTLPGRIPGYSRTLTQVLRKPTYAAGAKIPKRGGNCSRELWLGRIPQL